MLRRFPSLPCLLVVPMLVLAPPLARSRGRGRGGGGHRLGGCSGRSPGGGHGRIERSAAARDAFMRSHPCPSTGGRSGACPGYVVDHVIALKHGGADAPSNMEWQTIEAAKAKDRWE